MSVLLTKRVRDLATVPGGKTWLVRNLWPNQGVGIIGAEPKCGKTWLALDLAVSVASGSVCLGKYEVELVGPVLFFNGEDKEHLQRERLEAISKAKSIDLNELNVEVIVSDKIKLDKDTDVAALRETVAKFRPALLILDPFVRLHSINENNSAEVASLLDKLKSIQKDFGCAVILVHHQGKGGGKNTRGGSKMRGSNEFHAWGDANLYLRKDRQDNTTMDVELRVAQGEVDVPVKIVNVNGGTCLQVIESGEPEQVVSEPIAVSEELPAVELKTTEAVPFVKPQFKSGAEIDQERILALIVSRVGIATAELIKQAGMPVTKLSGIAFQLEQKGLVKKVAGRYYAK